MSDWQERLEALSPEKRRLLERRLSEEGVRLPPRTPAGGAPEVPSGGAGLEVSAEAQGAAGPLEMGMSVFFFSADATQEPRSSYRFLLETARRADRLGFDAVWVPERHFQDFGGLYPNPSLVAAALAMVTEKVEIRAGSVVLPLHHPVRVAEEWAVVDNLSGGRAAISCASGWHPSDFVLAPEVYEERKDVMFERLEILRRLWAGEPMRLPGGGGEEFEVKTVPRPVRRELPVWITSAGSVETWERAGEVGGHLLAFIGSQPLPDLEAKIRRYREARRRAGHDPAAGTVSLMLHTFLGDDEAVIRERVREPLTAYLRTHLAQRDNFLQIPGITEEDREALIPLAFEHYLRSASLIGTPETCAATIRRLAAIGVDEIACLVDFGLELGDVLSSLDRLAELRRELAAPAAAETGRREVPR